MRKDGDFMRDMPIGFSMKLAMNYDALTKFGTLSSEQKDRIIDYIKDAKTGDEAEMRTDEMIVSLNDSTKMWFND